MSSQIASFQVTASDLQKLIPSTETFSLSCNLEILACSM